MSNHKFPPLADFWENILSRNKELIKSAIVQVSKEERDQIIHHLQKMAFEPGWHEEQIISAKYALNVVQNGRD